MPERSFYVEGKRVVPAKDWATPQLAPGQTVYFVQHQEIHKGRLLSVRLHAEGEIGGATVFVRCQHSDDAPEEVAYSWLAASPQGALRLAFPDAFKDQEVADD